MIGIDQVAAVTIAVLGAAAAIWLMITNARGRVRVLAVVGTVLIMLGVITRFAFHWLSGRFLGELANETTVSLLAADMIAGGVLTGVGLLLLARALVVAS